jgi:hypothetical protein
MRICLDFDGVIHSFTSQWINEDDIPDKPITGCQEALASIKAMGAHIYIHSTRCHCQSGRKAIADYMTKHHLAFDEIVEHKPIADLYIDDRAILFTGDWQKVMVAIGLINKSSDKSNSLSSKTVKMLNKLFSKELADDDDG